VTRFTFPIVKAQTIGVSVVATIDNIYCFKSHCCNFPYRVLSSSRLHEINDDAARLLPNQVATRMRCVRSSLKAVGKMHKFPHTESTRQTLNAKSDAISYGPLSPTSRHLRPLPLTQISKSKTGRSPTVGVGLPHISAGTSRVFFIFEN